MLFLVYWNLAYTSQALGKFYCIYSKIKWLLNSLVFPFATYGTECCIINKSNKMITSFELWRYRRLLHVSWTENQSNNRALNKIQAKNHERLLNCIDKRKLAFVGYVTRSQGLGKDLLTGMVYGKRKRQTKNSICRQHQGVN